MIPPSPPPTGIASLPGGGSDLRGAFHGEDRCRAGPTVPRGLDLAKRKPRDPRWGGPAGRPSLHHDQRSAVAATRMNAIHRRAGLPPSIEFFPTPLGVPLVRNGKSRPHSSTAPPGTSLRPVTALPTPTGPVKHLDSPTSCCPIPRGTVRHPGQASRKWGA